MRKCLLVVSLILVSVIASYADELKAQYRVWKSSYLGGGVFTNVMISSSSIIFHMVYGSATVNQTSDNYFAVHQSTGDVFTTDSSTRAYIRLNESAISKSDIGVAYDVRASSHAYFTKTGGAIVGYLWDWYSSRPPHRTIHDGN